jgi:hypothetical protein
VVDHLHLLAAKEAKEAMTAVIAETTTATSVLPMPTRSVAGVDPTSASSCSIFRILRNVTAEKN